MQQLVDHVLSQQADADTYAELQRLLREDADGTHTAHIAAMLEAVEQSGLPAYDRSQGDAIVNRILAADGKLARPAKVRNLRYWWAAAAIVLMIAAAAAFLWQRPAQRSSGVTAQTHTHNDAAPGSSKATLTLGDGSVITLDSAGNQVLQQGAAAIHLKGGQLSYDVQGNDAVISYNTLKTPRGGQFQVKLPDGTGVWLNAASSLRYPTAFRGKERLVEVTGEAYFEVVKNAAMPFRVKVNGDAAIEVLGTSFNINAYEDEAEMQATLLEGAVRVTKGANATVLKPGQQARVGASINVMNDANVAQVMAWKNGVFDFNNMGLKEVMRQLARWYDIDVEYKGQAPGTEFWGKVGRNLTLSQVLKGLEGTGVHFEIKDNGKKLVVLP